MATDMPKLRDDLLVSRQDWQGQPVFVVKDPVDNQFFRLKEEEHFIAAQLDGQTPLETIRRRVEGQFDASLSSEALANFVASLRKSKLLEAASARSRHKSKRSRLRGSLLHLRFKLMDPDALFSRWVGAVRFCFTPTFVACGAAAIIWAIMLAVANWDGLRQDLAGLIRWDALIWLLAAMFAVSAAHEFAHGLTCKHFGGEVRELGLLLLYLQPALYCNVSDAWLLSEKRKRLWIGFAGPFLEMVLWACAILVWRVTDTETWLNFAGLVVIATSGIKTLLNLNPLLKLDGYYLLCDWLAIPNLRRRAFRYLGERMRRLAGFIGTAPSEFPRREQRIYLAYGLAAAVVSISLLGIAVAKLGGYFIANRQPEALIVAASVLGIKARQRFGRFFGKSPDLADPDDFSISEPLAAPGPNDTAPATESKRPHQKPPRFPTRLKLALLLLGIMLPVVFLVPMQLRIAGPFTVLPIQNADVRPEVGGAIEEILVDESDPVRKGDVIARLSERDLRVALQRNEADLAQARAQLELLKAGTRPEEVELARIGVTRSERRYQFAKQSLERDEQLLRDQLISKKEYESTRLAATESETDLAEARNKLQEALAGSRPEEIAAAKAGVARLQTQRRFVEQQLAQINVTSPADGIVATPSHALKEMVGKVVKEGDLIAKVHDLKSVEVESPVSEKDIADIKVGDIVALKARAYPEKTFFGTVTSVGATAQTGQAVSTVGGGTPGNASPLAARSSSSSTPTILVTTRIGNEDLLLKPGMTGMAKIYCGECRMLDVLLRRIARTFKVEFWSWW